MTYDFFFSPHFFSLIKKKEGIPLPDPERCFELTLPDCSDGDCCPQSWIGDGYCDDAIQIYGCDLSCYGNDGGDCGSVRRF